MNFLLAILKLCTTKHYIYKKEQKNSQWQWSKASKAHICYGLTQWQLQDFVATQARV